MSGECNECGLMGCVEANHMSDELMREEFDKIFYGKPTCEGDYLINWRSDEEFKKYLFTFYNRAWQTRQALDARLCRDNKDKAFFCADDAFKDCAKLIEETK